MNQAFTLALTVGSQFRYDGKTWQIVSVLDGASLHIRSTQGQAVVLSIQHLVSDPSFSSLTDPAAEPKTGIDTLSLLGADELRALDEKTAHVLEVLTGYRAGDPAMASPDEPRQGYAPTLAQSKRIRAKAGELGVHTRTIENWIRAYRTDGQRGMIDGNKILPRKDTYATWREVAAELLAERIGITMVGGHVVIPLIDDRVREQWPDAAIPGQTKKYAILKALNRNKQYFSGSVKGQKNRGAVPNRVYGYKSATRPGQFIVLDTTPLDVYAMDSLTGKWVRCQLTLAIDWCTRCIVGLSLTAYSTKAKDVASVLYQVVMPRPRLLGKTWPYVGVPQTIVVDGTKTELAGRPLGPALFPEGIVVDHGKQYISRHVWGACVRFGIHIQPARKARGSDKGILERYFRTIRTGLLTYLAGYMGPDIAHRGDDVERGAFYFVDELETMIRHWVEDTYHQRPHKGLKLPNAPSVDVSPAEMYRLRMAVTGPISVPARADLAIDFLPTVYRRINHYGVQLAKLFYNGDILADYRDRPSGLGGTTTKRNKWPIAYDPDDIRVVYFQDPTGRWHPLEWNKAHTVGGPFSLDLLRATKKLLDPRGERTEPLDVMEILARLPLATAENFAARKALVRESIMSRDKLTHDARTYATENLSSSQITMYEQITQVAAADAAELDVDDWADLLALDDDTYEESR